MTRDNQRHAISMDSQTIDFALIKSCESELWILMITDILKTHSSKEAPLKESEIYTKLSMLFGETIPSQKTLSRTLDKLTRLSHLAESDNTIPRQLSTLFQLTLGGNIVSVKTGKKQIKYYFEPIIDAGNLNMICGSVISNHYISKESCDYLVKVLHILNATAGKNDSHNATAHTKALSEFFPQRPSSAKHAGTFLENVTILYEAIQNKYQVELTYAAYQVNQKKAISKPELIPSSPESKLVNPYALLWNHGQYYLIATYDGSEKPYHFRVDRIQKATIAKEPEDARECKAREKMPDTLKPFFKRNIFLEKQYTAKFANMWGMHTEVTTLDHVMLNCPKHMLGNVIDYFGKEKIQIYSDTPDTQINSRFINPDFEMCHIKIKDVNYDNVLLYCLEHHYFIKVTEPAELIEDIKKELISSLERY
ncbi:MAG: WYL domain-containing protein [Lachnospiraceae bacterium]|nr:WYL domain-containing protein [Lachnospiraceae bacterium]